MEINELKEKIINLYNCNEYLMLHKYYSTDSVFNVIRKSRDESTHSNFIAWLLNDKSNHLLGNYPIRKLLELICKEKDNPINANSQLNDEISNNIIVGNYKIIDVEKVTTEYPLDIVVKKGRIDILIEIKMQILDSIRIMPLVIENKIKSKEIDNQTDKYYSWAQKEYINNKDYFEPIYVYLNPDHSKCTCDKYFVIDYQNLVEYVIEPLLYLEPSKFGKIMIENYLRCLTYTNINENGEKDKKEKIIAMTSNEKEMLQNLYQKNKDLFNSVINVLINDPNSEMDDKTKDTLVREIGKRDYTKYSFNGKTYAKNQLVLALVKEYVKDNKTQTFDDLLKVFPKKLQGSLGVIAKYNDVVSKGSYTRWNRFYYKNEDIIELGDKTKICVCSQWGVDNINNILSVAKQNEYSVVIANN